MERVLFIIILLVHRVIHLVGFLKAYKLWAKAKRNEIIKEKFVLNYFTPIFAGTIAAERF